ncbi:hypothetical protein GH714_027711 [Hevea brasiliensis]|uniref:PUM-HD domain-containing protein n=1 Tax=Hevea brasiliensis TaxID=3981 RepID=A0A6A6MLE2_HEVBR|nr:hypothetical protein GH714_027711 [Hevea brasiliensis]
MEVGRTEVDFDEFEKLLGEIPNATSGNPHSEEAAPKSVSLNDSLAPICVNSFKGPLIEKLQSSAGLDERKRLINKTQGSPIKRVQLDEANLPDDQSLTSAFADLSFNSGSISANFKSSLNHGVPLDCKLTNSMKNLVPGINSSVTGAPSFQSPNSMPCDFDGFNVTKVVQERSNLLKLNALEPKQMPIEIPLISDQGQYFADMQSVLPCIHSQQLNQPHISWRNIEEEQFYRMHQQYLYLQQMRNQRLEAQHPIKGNGNVATKLVNWNVRQPYFEVPISHQIQQSSQEAFWNNYAVTRGLNQSHNGINVLDKLGKHSFPEKILTRSQGLNTLKAVKFGSVGGNESLANLNQNGKVISNGHPRHNLSTPGAGYFPLDHLSSWNLSDDITDLKNTNLRPQPQKYNSVDEVTGRVYLMAKDQHGCRFLQRKFSEGTPQDVEKIFFEIIDHIIELMTDPFGNYLVQKLLEVCNEDQRMQILCAITRKAGELVRISCDMHGTRAVQKVIETLKTPEQFSMVVSSLKSGIVTLIKNMNGNHVAQHCLQYLTPEYSERSNRSQDQNYVVQFVFELRLPWATADIFDQLEGALHAILVEAIRPHIPVLRTSPYGKKVLSNNSLKK